MYDMRIGALCGTFDPVTLGHVDLIERASVLFDELVVFISPNSQKHNYFKDSLRLKWLQEATSHLDNVTCKIQKGLVVDACKQVGATTLVRGIRTTIDFEYEKNMAYMNTQIDSEIDTICLFTRPEYELYSSSNVRELLKYGQDISHFVPQVVVKDLSEVQV